MNDLICCANPSQTNLHEVKHVINEEGRYVAEPCWNRICTRCNTHWYGHPESLEKYTRQQWDEMMNKTFEKDAVKA